MSDLFGGRPVVSVRHRVTAPVGSVWAALADGWSATTWIVGACRIREVDPRWPAAGASARFSVGIWPVLLPDTTTVVRSEPGVELVLRSRARPVGEATIRLLLAPDGADATIVVLQEDVTGGPGRFLPRWLRRLALTPRDRETLRRLGLLAERHPR